MSQPVWGICRHGLVTGGQLALENGGSFNYIQPNPLSTDNFNVNGTFWPESYGYTIGVKVPDVAVISRTVDEAANDYAKGYVWQNMATMSAGGKQINRKIIGPNGWIYCAPDGSRWKVALVGIVHNTAYSLSAPLNFTLRLDRFGELLGQPERHDLPMTIADFGKGSSDWPGGITSAMWLIGDCSSNGERAILEGAKIVRGTSTSPAGSEMMEVRQIFAFHEFVLSGTPGVDFAASLSILYSSADIAVVTGDHDMTSQGWCGWHYLDAGGDPITPNVWVYGAQGDPLPSGAVEWQDCALPSKTVAHSDGHRLVSVWYDESDLPVPLLIRGTADVTYSLAAPSSPSQSSSSSWTSSVWMEWGAHSTAALTETGSSSASWSWPARNTFDSTVTVVQSQDTAGLPEYTYTYTDDDPFPPGINLAAAYRPDVVVSVIAAEVGSTMAPWHSYPFRPARYSNSVIGMQHVASAGAGTTFWQHLFPPMTKAGIASGSVLSWSGASDSGPVRYGSFNPATGETTWGGTVPVCYV